MIGKRVLVAVDVEHTPIKFISVKDLIDTALIEEKRKYPLNIFKALSASSSVAKTTAPNPRDLPSGPRATSARVMVPACRNKSFRSCHWQ